MNIDKAMKKWRIGVLVLGLLSVGLLIFVIVQGVSSKSDRQTLKQATTIADKLNSYVSDNQTVPVSLSEAGINGVPNSVSYTRQSSSTYEFCVTWKTANTDVSSTVQSDLYNATTNGGYSSSNSSTGYGSSGYQPSDLYIDSNHKAGKQCQTVKPYVYDYNSYDNYNSDNSGNSTNLYNNDSTSNNSSDYYSQ